MDSETLTFETSTLELNKRNIKETIENVRTEEERKAEVRRALFSYHS